MGRLGGEGERPSGDIRAEMRDPGAAIVKGKLKREDNPADLRAAMMAEPPPQDPDDHQASNSQDKEPKKGLRGWFTKETFENIPFASRFKGIGGVAGAALNAYKTNEELRANINTSVGIGVVTTLARFGVVWASGGLSVAGSGIVGGVFGGGKAYIHGVNREFSQMQKGVQSKIDLAHAEGKSAEDKDLEEKFKLDSKNFFEKIGALDHDSRVRLRTAVLAGAGAGAVMGMVGVGLHEVSASFGGKSAVDTFAEKISYGAAVGAVTSGTKNFTERFSKMLKGRPGEAPSLRETAVAIRNGAIFGGALAGLLDAGKVAEDFIYSERAPSLPGGVDNDNEDILPPIAATATTPATTVPIAVPASATPTSTIEAATATPTTVINTATPTYTPTPVTPTSTETALPTVTATETSLPTSTATTAPATPTSEPPTATSTETPAATPTTEPTIEPTTAPTEPPAPSVEVPAPSEPEGPAPETETPVPSEASEPETPAPGAPEPVPPAEPEMPVPGAAEPEAPEPETPDSAPPAEEPVPPAPEVPVPAKPTLPPGAWSPSGETPVVASAVNRTSELDLARGTTSDEQVFYRVDPAAAENNVEALLRDPDRSYPPEVLQRYDEWRNSFSDKGTSYIALQNATEPSATPFTQNEPLYEDTGGPPPDYAPLGPDQLSLDGELRGVYLHHLFGQQFKSVGSFNEYLVNHGQDPNDPEWQKIWGQMARGEAPDTFNGKVLNLRDMVMRDQGIDDKKFDDMVTATYAYVKNATPAVNFPENPDYFDRTKGVVLPKNLTRWFEDLEKLK